MARNNTPVDKNSREYLLRQVANGRYSLLLIVILFFRNGLFGHNEVTWRSIGNRLRALSGHRREVSGHE